jgi:hypothetical protein
MASCGLMVLVIVGAACGGGSGKPDGGGSGGAGGGAGNRWTGTISGSINRNVDILVLVDDSSSMRLSQDNLNRNFPVFMTTLMNSPQGLPNIHLAVISQDMGAGDGSIASCDATSGKKGIFQYTARGTCTSTGLQAGATYISDVVGARNYTGNLADVFTCIAALGESGCGYEHQFAAVLRALGADGMAAPAENQGFLRPDAYLAIVMVTNEDDCSDIPGAGFFDTSLNTNLASTLGPPINFRCNEWGHLCKNAGGATVHPSRNAPGNDMTSMVTYTDCTSDDSGQKLRSVADTANRIKALKADPSMVAVISIQGPADPYTVTWQAPNVADNSCGAASCPWPAIAHSCTASDGSFADPGVRTSELVNMFGSKGLVLPICSDEYAPSMQRAAELIDGLFGPSCSPGRIALNRTTGSPDCKVTETYVNASGATVNKTVPYCDDVGDLPPCWSLIGDAQRCGVDRSTVDVSFDPDLGASTPATVKYDCTICSPSDPSC